MVQISDDLCSSLAEAIRRVADPDLVLLFGSQAKGLANEQSDVDLLVVQEKPKWVAGTRRAEIGRIRRALPRLGFPVDLLLFTPSEVEHWRGAKNHVVAEALSTGIVVYERP